MLLDVDNRREVGDGRLREVEPNSVVVDSGHSRDGDGNFLLAPEVPFVEKNVGYLVITRIDHESTYMSDWTVRCMYVLSTSYLDLTWWHLVVSDCLL